jgi:hypothetical protein
MLDLDVRVIGAIVLVSAIAQANRNTKVVKHPRSKVTQRFIIIDAIKLLGEPDDKTTEQAEWEAAKAAWEAAKEAETEAPW